MSISNPQYPLLDHAAEEGELTAADLQVHAETLRAQARVAEQSGFPQLAKNLLRAAELTAVPNEELLRMYTVLRPGRSTYAELLAMAQTLAETYDAPLNAAWVREAAEVYQRRGLVKRD
jgi:propanediol dehydratase small subunit